MGLFSRAPSAIPTRPHGREVEHSAHRGWRKLVLVRHGQTDYNVKHLLPGQLPGIPLNDEGKSAARASGEAIRPLPISTIVASPLEPTMNSGLRQCRPQPGDSHRPRSAGYRVWAIQREVLRRSR